MLSVPFSLQDEFSKFIFGCTDALVLIGVSAYKPPSSVVNKLVNIIFKVLLHPHHFCCLDQWSRRLSSSLYSVIALLYLR